MMWKLMCFFARHKATLKFYRCMVNVYTRGVPKKTFLNKVKVGDILMMLGEYDWTTGQDKAGEMVTVIGSVYDDGEDDVIPVVTNDGKEMHLSPLLVY